MKRTACLYFWYLYPLLENQLPIISQFSNSLHSAQVSRFLSLKQQTLILHFALLMSLSFVSKPILHPLQDPSIKGLHVLQ